MSVIHRERRHSGERMHRVLVDVTTSLMVAEDPPMGISRVEGEIARRLLAMTDLRAIPVVFRNDGLILALSPEQADRIFTATANAARQSRLRFRGNSDNGAPPLSAAALPARLRHLAMVPLRRATRGGIARLPASVREDVRAILIHARQIVRTAGYRQPGTEPASETKRRPLREALLPTLRMAVHPGPGDVLWTAGLYSNFVPLRTIAELRTRSGFAVVATCYDLIRMTHPEFNPPSMGAELFVADAVALLDAADLVLAISQASRRELLTVAERTGRTAPHVQVIPLGSDLPIDDAPEDLQIPVCPHDIPSRHFALAVGTVEPRKNYGLLLRVWERLVADVEFSLDLVIVGRLGFEAEDIAAEIERSQLFGRRVFWLESCPDQVLRRLYENCHFVLCPSFAEGWGLPVAEALALGRHVIASNRGALPEAGQGLIQLLDPTDEAGWATAIGESAAVPRRAVTPPQLPTWDDAATTVAAALRHCLEPVEAT